MFTVGVVVDAKYLRGPNYYRAKIVAQEADGKFVIDWLDTDSEDRVKTKRDFRFPRIPKAEWKQWSGAMEDYKLPEFIRKLNTLVPAMN